jgi:hypothetical protein
MHKESDILQSVKLLREGSEGSDNNTKLQAKSRNKNEIARQKRKEFL